MSEDRHRPVEGIETLSPAGHARRDAMLDELVVGMRHLHRRRRATRRAIAATVLVTLVAGLAVIARPRASAPPASDRVAADAAPPSVSPPATTPRAEFRIVRTDPGVIERLTVPAAPQRATALDDAALLAELAAMNRTAGLIRMGDRVWLTGNVTEPDAARDEPLPPT